MHMEKLVCHDCSHCSRLQSSSPGTDPNEEELRKTAQSNPKPPSFIERYLWTPLLGPPYVSGDWKTVEGPSNKFVDRFGPVFEDYRHIPGRRK